MSDRSKENWDETKRAAEDDSRFKTEAEVREALDEYLARMARVRVEIGPCDCERGVFCDYRLFDDLARGATTMEQQRFLAGSFLHAQVRMVKLKIRLDELENIVGIKEIMERLFAVTRPEDVEVPPGGVLAPESKREDH